MIRSTLVALALTVASLHRACRTFRFSSRTTWSFLFAKDVARDVNWSMASAYGTPRCGPRSASAALEECAW